MRRRLAIAGLVALMAANAAAQTITSARLEGPTDRYPHGALGDTTEHHTLSVTLSDGTATSARYEAVIVFEDTKPRLADVDGDGSPEVIVVESHESQGARLVVWGVEDGALRQLARTPFIGTRFRWLAPVGAMDLDGDGAVEIAYVDRPHLAKTLRIWRYRNGRLEHVADRSGLTNHRIGEDFISGGLRDCGAGAEIITADADWRQVIASRLENGRIESRVIAPFSGPEGFAAALACAD